MFLKKKEIVSVLEFNQAPSTPWIKLLLTRRDKLRKIQTIPRIEAVWKNVLIENIDGYNDICHYTGKNIPITYPQVLATPIHMQILADKRFPLPALGLVHISQEITLHEPLSVGDNIEIRSWVDGHHQVSNGVQFVLNTQIHRQGTLCWEAAGRVFSRAAKGNKQKSSRLPEPEIEKDNPINWSLPENLGRRYTKISGDFNPIHLYQWTAKPFGFPRHIIHGMWTMARAINHFSRQPKKVHVHFIRPVFLPSNIHFHPLETEEEGLFIVQSTENQKTQMWGTIEY